MGAGKTFADFSAELAALSSRVDSVVTPPLGDHAARAEHFAFKAAVYREIAALFEAVTLSPLATERVVLTAMTHAEDHYREWAGKYDQFAAQAAARAGGGR